MLPAPTAVLGELDPVGRVALRFVGLIVTPLALLARQRNEHSDTCGHAKTSRRLSAWTVSQSPPLSCRRNPLRPGLQCPPSLAAVAPCSPCECSTSSSVYAPRTSACGGP